MDKITLARANSIANEIRELEVGLNCFEYESDPANPPVSTNPKLIIEYDGPDGREETKLPMQLSDDLIFILKNHITFRLAMLQEQLQNL